ncbi:beta-lactamase/transpeptidase-like protein [Schizothecium vesticola]|uniref:Beta-lactamase/transpeptidase-like protein n=1 Tax=Schizothecium vesticola TaxID=314040 RepID=A0AA40ELC3_9PEZI|nr:beta-lactamase/transpeptidase-like protein [Schizothecium vesticola]
MVRAALFPLLALTASLSSAQNCPFLGPVYHADISASAMSDPLKAATAAFDKAVDKAMAEGRIDGAKGFWGIDIYAAKDEAKKSLYSRYYTATAGTNRTAVTVGPDTVFRAFSISKLITVYTFLAAVGDERWHEPITKYVPELAKANKKWAPERGGFNWDEVTLGSLAGQISGLGKDYAMNDLSTVDLGGPFPGIRKLKDSEIVRCGAVGLQPCTREESFDLIMQRYPLSIADNTPGYSNMAFQILSYAAEKITNTPFPELIKRHLIKPLNLTRTFVTSPGESFPDSVIIPRAWDVDLGDLAPNAGYYISTQDLSLLGRSVLRSTLLPARSTRAWLKATSHTGYLMASMGKPWEILRRNVAVSPGSNVTRVTDLYTKQGGGTSSFYTTILSLAVDYGVGMSITSAASPAGDLFVLRDLFDEVFLPALEETQRQGAMALFGGEYKLDDNSTATVTVVEGEPALFLPVITSEGTDYLDTIRQALGLGYKGFGAFLYPMGLSDGNKVAFRATWGVPGKTVLTNCASWAEHDRARYGGYPGDLFIFHVGKDGKATGLEIPLMGKTLRKV